MSVSDNPFSESHEFHVPPLSPDYLIPPSPLLKDSLSLSFQSPIPWGASFPGIYQSSHHYGNGPSGRSFEPICSLPYPSSSPYSSRPLQSSVLTVSAGGSKFFIFCLLYSNHLQSSVTCFLVVRNM